MMVESSDEGGDDLSFCDVGNTIPHHRKASYVAAEELRWLLVDAVQIMFGARPNACSHVVVGENFFQLFLGSNGVRGKACEPVYHGWHEHDGKLVCHDTCISSGGANSSDVSL